MNTSVTRLVRTAHGLVNAHMKEVQSLYSLPSNNSCGGLNGTELGDDSMGGLPQTITFTSSIFVVLLVLFGFLRRDAFDSGRELLRRKWHKLIFNEDRDSSGGPRPTTFCGSLGTLLGISDEMMVERAGVDAVMYLRLTRHLTAVVAVWTVFCLSVALPINMHGDLDGGKVSFGETTLHNLRPEDPLLWALVVLQVLALPLVWTALRMFLRPVCAGAGLRRPRTLMLSRVDPSTDPLRDTRMLLLQHFREAHPEQEIVEIQVALDVHRLMALQEEHDRALDALRSAWDFQRFFGEPLLMRPHTCANLCGCACCACCGARPEIRAFDFYAVEERRLRTEVSSERRACAARPLPVAFVTFATSAMATAVWEQYAPCVPRPRTTAAPRLAANDWDVDIAPDHRDILWEHLETGRNLLSVRFVMTNAALFFITFFLTTPALVVNLLDRLAQYSRAGEFVQQSKLLTELLPTVLLYSVAELMPMLIGHLDESSHHWTTPEQHASIMAKTFAFLTLMVLVLPSLGLTSAEALMSWLLKPSDQAFRWDCVFLPDKGALFVNYVTTAAFVGCGLDLVRAPELVQYYFRYLFTKSEAEATYLSRQAVPKFPFGEKYAWTLLIFTMSIANGIACPLITPAGLVYMCLRQVVDRHNLYHTFARTRAGRRLHATAARSALAAVLLLQFSLAALSVARHRLDAAAMVSFASAFLTAALLVAHLIADSWFGYSLVAGKKVNWTLIREEETPGCYRAPVLRMPDEGEPDFGEPGVGEEEELGEDAPLLGKQRGRRS